jgi:hypothetical protein
MGVCHSSLSRSCAWSTRPKSSRPSSFRLPTVSCPACLVRPRANADTRPVELGNSRGFRSYDVASSRQPVTQRDIVIVFMCYAILRQVFVLISHEVGHSMDLRYRVVEAAVRRPGRANSNKIPADVLSPKRCSKKKSEPLYCTKRGVRKARKSPTPPCWRNVGERCAIGCASHSRNKQWTKEEKTPARGGAQPRLLMVRGSLFIVHAMDSNEHEQRTTNKC